ncbi:aromatic ring-hydroxylating dioxygenase subunit alpha [Bradyrhizobium sp. SSUT112]|uniref:aromatic ring-hydroxylating oxygenase subunit alpha n=1 Tax=Bradyrhizobium sp. SSUT112 TaxID=3040604 RepID=UPI00244AE97E|nr:aromatic ring-hydroxylating dioxygenase subunit alpha [Bradyrhizobium sp. SSUT112]MDH2356504.1 aromatic ring-hydroxylating dioxygenase subunit alpha [Bradyrhizobium sp. SSUT112]
MAELLDGRQKFFTLPQRLYNDPAFFAIEIDGIFKRRWLFAGVVAQIPKPGDFFTVPVGPSSILVVRDRSGEIRAFHNTCRHRGSTLCEAEQGRVSSIVCPYHLWTYDLTGKLRSAKGMHDDFDRSEYSLLPVHIETAGSTIYVCLADDPPDFSVFKATLAPYLASHELEKGKLAHIVHVPVAGNWKLVVENSRECFHCPTGHPELARSFITVYRQPYPQSMKGLEALWQRCAAAGMTYGDSGRQDSGYRIERLPLRPGCRSITMDGIPAVTRRLGQVPDGDFGTIAWSYTPTSFNQVVSDYAFHARMLPIGPEQSLLSGYWIVDADAVEGRDYNLANLIKVWDETNLQDRDLIERNQRGVNSAGYRPGPYSQESEMGVVNFVDWYCEMMSKYLGGPERRVLRTA